MTRGRDNQLPVKLYRSDHRLTVAAPMPGVEPQDIVISLSGEGKLSLDADLRGEFKGDKDVIMDEWEAGDYHRTLSLDMNVDATTANATYENGVLVVSLPISNSLRPARIELDRISATEGKREGTSGHPGSR